ncbi:MAG: spore coat associated protein CotJA [Bacillota bacterium]|jgi:hypothetical protein|nr:spore coat associated protein CotJA [Desulfitobacteriaceae bacterium]MDD4752850.1 spore coat associated protein CotJA [Desulfitobacteriaceae bacterium]NMA14588.1 spore coat associated protein CotJA [Clostridia bacterium]
MPKATMMASVDLKLAQAYVPDQPYERLFPLDEALERGTIFPSLYRPYKPKK